MGTGDQKDSNVGKETKIKVVKNKVAPPFKTAVVDIMYGTGISHEGEVIDLATDAEIIEKSGAWYSYNGEKIGQGKENTKMYLINNPELLNEIEDKVRDCYGIADKEKIQKEKKKLKSEKEETE